MAATTRVTETLYDKMKQPTAQQIAGAAAAYAEARLGYDKAWHDYVDAPGDREQARTALGEARRVLDKAWRDYNRRVDQ